MATMLGYFNDGKVNIAKVVRVDAEGRIILSPDSVQPGGTAPSVASNVKPSSGPDSGQGNANQTFAPTITSWQVINRSGAELSYTVDGQTYLVPDGYGDEFVRAAGFGAGRCRRHGPVVQPRLPLMPGLFRDGTSRGLFRLPGLALPLPVPDTSPPTVTLAVDRNRLETPGSFLFTATASDDRGVAAVEFYLDGTLEVTVLQAPYTFELVAAGFEDNGDYSVVARAYDAAGNVAGSAALAVEIAVAPPYDARLRYLGAPLSVAGQPLNFGGASPNLQAGYNATLQLDSSALTLAVG